MIEEHDFKLLIAEIMRLGYDRPTAGRYAALIGDTPVADADGRILVKDADGKTLAALKLKFFEE